MEQINQGAAAKPPASGHQGGFLEYISVSKVPRNHLISTIPAARVTRKQSASVPETGLEGVTETVLKGTASMEKPQHSWAF